MDHHRVNSESPERTVNPEPEVPGFIDRVIDSSREVPVQVLDQQSRIRRLREILVISLAEIYADLPTAPGDINPDIDMLTRELDLRTLPSHGKPRSGGGILLVDTTIYSLGSRLPAFLNIPSTG
jgi:hypothetical protein